MAQFGKTPYTLHLFYNNRTHILLFLCLFSPVPFFKEFSLGGGGGGWQNRKKRQNDKYEPSRFGERTSLKRDFVKL